MYRRESVLLSCEIKKAREVSQKSGWVNWGWPVRKQNIYNLILHHFLGILPTSLIINIFTFWQPTINIYFFSIKEKIIFFFFLCTKKKLFIYLKIVNILCSIGVRIAYDMQHCDINVSDRSQYADIYRPRNPLKTTLIECSSLSLHFYNEPIDPY